MHILSGIGDYGLSRRLKVRKYLVDGLSLQFLAHPKRMVSRCNRIAPSFPGQSACTEFPVQKRNPDLLQDLTSLARGGKKAFGTGESNPAPVGPLFHEKSRE